MDSEIERPRHDHDFECEETAAPTAADAVVQQISVEPDSLLKNSAGRSRSEQIGDPSAAASLAATLRYIASQKNVSLLPGQVDGAVLWAEKTLLEMRSASLVPLDSPFADPTA